MRILLFGEFSGFFNCLRDGLVDIGHEVYMVSNGDGKRGYPADYNWYVSPEKYGRYLSHVLEIKNVLSHRDLIRGYDAVMLIHPTIFSGIVPVIKPIFNYILNHNDKVFLSGAGLTPISVNYWYNSEEKYHNYVKGLILDKQISEKKMGDKSLLKWENELLDRINGYIPIWYEYAKPFKEHPHCLKTIRIPINYNQHAYSPNIIHDKIVFFASISPRKNAKGFSYIKAAFEKMGKNYGDVAEFVYGGGLPFKEYMQLVSKANVLLDDANSCSVAMNGLFSMCKGKVVMGGAEPYANEELGLDWNPVYNLCPDVDQICSCIEDVINNREHIEEMGKRSRQFVEEYHDYRKIANDYVKVFETY